MSEHADTPRITVRMCVEVISARYNVSRGDLLSARRTRPVVLPRQIVMWLAKERTPRSLPEIGRQLGGRDHTTILHGIRQVEARRAADPNFRRETDEIIGTIDGTMRGVPNVAERADLPDALRVAIRIDGQGARANVSDEELSALALFVILQGLQRGMLQVEGDPAEVDPELEAMEPIRPLSSAVADHVLAEAAEKVVKTRRRMVAALYSPGERAARESFEAALVALETLFEERT